MEVMPVTSFWQSRPETPEQLAQRLRVLLELLRPIAPPFRQWFQVVDDETFRLVDDDDSWLADNIAARVARDDLRQPSLYFGYNTCSLSTTPDKIIPGSISVHMRAGGCYINSLNIQPLGRAPPDPAYVTYSILKRAMLAVSQAFEPDWCSVGPFSLWKNLHRSDYARGPILLPCWMIHLSPPLARQVTPPADLVSERYADGSLFLAATDETFDPENAAHVAAAHRLFALVDPLQEKLPRDQWRR